VTVHLVGAGPGDPGLLTQRAVDVLARADVVVFDRLVDPAILALVPEAAERIDVGKRPARGAPGDLGATSDRQLAINQLLIDRGRSGATVVRLKGGDPFVFGRGGEEVEALRDAGVDWEVVPGVTSALAAPAYAGIPVTHRGLSTSVTLVTGHVGDPTAPGGVDWASLARAGGTIVILMGMANRAEIARALEAGGRPGETAVAVVEWGTTASQRVVRTTLGALEKVELGSPAVIVVGPVASLDLRPRGALGRRTVVVTRPRQRGGDLVDGLRALGVHVVQLPAIEFAEPADGGAALRRAADEVASYDWVVFTSASAVHRFVRPLRDARAFGPAKIAVVGPGTSAALGEHNLVADLVAERADAQGLADSLPDAPPGGRVLFPRAEGASDTLASGLRDRGWTVDEVVAYRTVSAPGPDIATAEAVGAADAVTFASPSAVAAFLAMRDAGGSPLTVPPLVVCIGPVTARAARQHGLSRVVSAATPAPADVIAAIEQHLGPAGDDVPTVGAIEPH
jgi:uroporphyrinogen III methyltransferase/synthase